MTKGQDLVLSKKSPFDWATQPLSEISYKSYGPSGVGSLSYRGLPASQMPLVWNGISLSSPLLGQVDINQIPISSQWAARLEGTSDISPIAGGQPASRLSVQMASMIPDSAKVGLVAQTKMRIGTYGQRQSESAFQVKQGHWQTYGRYFFQQARNDFAISRSAGADPALPARQVNSENFNRQAEEVVSYHNSENTYSITLAYLYNQSYRNLPPPITKYFAHESLFAETQALSLQQQWRTKSGFSYKSVSGLVSEQSRYQDEVGIHYPYATAMLQLAGVLTFDPLTTGKYRLSGISLSHSHSFAHPTQGDYGAHQQQSHIITAEASCHWGSIAIIPSMGIGLYKGRAYSLPGVKLIQSRAFGRLTYRTTLSTISLFRAPTLNDLYYPTLGDPNLQVEHGRHYEAKFSAENRQEEPVHAQFSLSPFAYQYRSFIAWTPRGNVWAPRQRSDARSSGITALAAASIHLGRWRLAGRQQVTWAQSGYGGPLLTLNSRPEPFIYTPSLRSTSSLSLSRSDFTIELRTVFTSTDSLAGLPPLPAFFIHTGKFEWIIDKEGHQWSLAAQASWANPPGYAFIANYAAPRWWGNLTVAYRFLYAR